MVLSGAVVDRMTLVFGLPRTGTSWLGKIFDSHPDTFYLHEPDKHVRLAEVPVVMSAANAGGPAILQFLQRTLSNRSPGVVGKLPDFPKSYRTPARRVARLATASLCRAMPRRLHSRLSVPDLLDGRRAPHWVWKSINSVGRLGPIARVLQGARIVLIVRHPCGQIASILRGYTAGKLPGVLPSEQFGVLEHLTSTEQARRRGLTLPVLRAMHPLERMAWRWVLVLERAVEDLRGDERLRLVRHEDLCAAPADVARDLLRFGGLDWHPQTAAFLAASTAGGEDFFGVCRDPAKAASRWREELSEPDVRRILGVLAESPMQALYAPGASELSLAEGGSEAFRAAAGRHRA